MTLMRNYYEPDLTTIVKANNTIYWQARFILDSLPYFPGEINNPTLHAIETIWKGKLLTHANSVFLYSFCIAKYF